VGSRYGMDGRVHGSQRPLVRLTPAARAALGPGEALVFDWTRVPVCCAVAGEVSLRRSTRREADGRGVLVALGHDGEAPVFAHRRALPLLAGRTIEVDCRRRLGVRAFTSSLPPALGLRAAFGLGDQPSSG
jgi:hypothetical protein